MSDASKPTDPPTADERKAGMRQRLLYGLSVPERALRSAAGLFGGALRESAGLLLPDAIRNAKTYRAFIGQMLDFMAEDIGGAEPSRTAASAPSPGDRVEGYMARKTVGNFVDLVSLATLHLSPMLLLAVVSDVAYGSKAWLRELAEELQRQGVVEDAAAIERADDLLEAVAAASAQTASVLDTPPLSAEGLREAVRQARESLTGVDVRQALPERDLAGLWEAMQASARRQGVSPFNLSALMTLASLETAGKVGAGALSTVQATGALLDRNFVAHYRATLADIDDKGFYPSLAAASRTYLKAASRNFSPSRKTATEDYLERAAQQALSRARRWANLRDDGSASQAGGKAQPPPSNPPPLPTDQ